MWRQCDEEKYRVQEAGRDSNTEHVTLKTCFQILFDMRFQATPGCNERRVVQKE